MHLRSIIQWLTFRSLHIRVMLGIVVPIALVIGGLSYFDFLRQQQHNDETLAMFAAHISSVILNDLRHQMLDSDFEGLQELLITIGELDGVQAVYLLDTDGEVIFGSEEATIGLKFDSRQQECQACHEFNLQDRPSSFIVTPQGGEPVYRNAQVIDNEEACRKCHKDASKHLGVLLTDLSFVRYEASLFRDTRDHFIWWSGALIVTLAVVGLVFHRFVLERLNEIGRQIGIVGAGRLVPLLPDHPRDEIGRIAAAFNDMVIRLDKREADNALLSESLRLQNEQRGQLLNRLISAQEQERQRVAREIHDVLGQSLSGLALRTQALKRLIGVKPTQTANQLEDIDMLIRDTTEKMYNMILDLRPSVLDDLGLIPALRSHAERVFQPVGIDFKINVDSPPERLPAEIETTIYRTFQEALNNIVRHADAKHVVFSMRHTQDCFESEISDDGVGFDLDAVDLSGDSPRGLGILGMKERVAQIGGELSVVTRNGNGTRVILRFCLNEVRID